MPARWQVGLDLVHRPELLARYVRAMGVERRHKRADLALVAVIDLLEAIEKKHGLGPLSPEEVDGIYLSEVGVAAESPPKDRKQGSRRKGRKAGRGGN